MRLKMKLKGKLHKLNFKRFRLLHKCLIGLICFVTLCNNSYSQEFINYNTERILNYHVDIQVDTTGDLLVTETIRVNVLNQQINRGIFRMLPDNRNINNQNIDVDYSILSIEKNGAVEDYHTETSNGFYLIYIGNENIILTPGIYTYAIKYKTKRQIGFFENYDELYWNTTGSEWDFPIDTVTAVVNLPAGVRIIQNACYTGGYGSIEQKCSSQRLSSSSYQWAAFNLNPKEGLTIAVGFSKGVVKPPFIPDWLHPQKMKQWLIFVGLLFIGLLIYQWYKRGKDYQSPVVVPRFEPPNNLSPAGVGYIFNGGYKKSFIAASLVNLAVNQYVKIAQIKKKGFFSKEEYTISKRKEDTNDLVLEESTLLNSLLPHQGNTVHLDGEYDANIAQAVKSFQNSLDTKYLKMINEGNHKKISFLFFAVLGLFFLSLSFWVDHYYHLSGEIIGSVFTFAVYTVLFIIVLVVGYRKSRWIWLIVAIVTGLVILLWSPIDGTLNAYNILILFFIILMVALSFFSFAIRRPSKEVLQLQSEIEGFKMYLGAAENHLIQFNNPPSLTPELFEKYLPYALVLGVDEIWGKNFDKLIQNGTIKYENQWYSGTSSFSYNFANSMSHSLTSSITSSSTQPSSSSSGSSGGGFSGGGGGGGGGGGW